MFSIHILVSAFFTYSKTVQNSNFWTCLSSFFLFFFHVVSWFFRRIHFLLLFLFLIFESLHKKWIWLPIKAPVPLYRRKKVILFWWYLFHIQKKNSFSVFIYCYTICAIFYWPDFKSWRHDLLLFTSLSETSCSTAHSNSSYFVISVSGNISMPGCLCM